ncbi:MAG: AraC family transcriptional regulator [Kibdelosporangium sp.]
MTTRTTGILRLLAAVNRRRNGDVSLVAMAALAHRSRFDLHRRFRQVTGEAPKAYTSRVRLARAAAQLLATNRLTSQVAAANGFASHEVFTRSFTRHFGVSPREYRARGLQGDVRTHADIVDSAAPCVGLYRMTVSDQRKAAVPVDIVVKEFPAVHALVMRRSISRDEIAAALSECLPTVFAYAQTHGLAMTGPPFARYPEVSMGSLVLEAGVTIAEPAPGEPGDGIEAITIPAGAVAVTIHKGPYERLQETHQAVEAWMRDEGLLSAGPPRETYLTDPGDHPDPETWETEIAQPVRSRETQA